MHADHIRNKIQLLILGKMQEENDANRYTSKIQYFDVLFHRETYPRVSRWNETLK